MTAIRLERIRKTYGNVVAVDNVSAELGAGKLTFLLGPSGCGKTTILRMIAGFIDPTSGTIRFDDRDVSGLPANRRNTGMVFQSYALWPHMTVAENVAFALDVRKVPASESRTKVERALAMVKMATLGERKPTELSGGQQQRVALARALVFEPDVLLLDEPLSNLDAKLRLEMRTEIRRIVTETGVSAVYVTHDQEEALSIADSIVVLKDGRVMQTGGPRELYRRPESRFVADFLGETNFVPGRIVATRDGALDIETPFARLTARGITPKTPPDGAVVVSLRPEALHVAPDGAANSFRVEQAESMYLGKSMQHRVRARGRDGALVELKTLELNPHGVQREGKPVTLAVEAEDVVVLPA